VLGGLKIYPIVANFLQCMCAKNYENWLTTDKVMGIMDEVFWITVYDHTSYKETTTIIPTSELTMADKKMLI